MGCLAGAVGIPGGLGHEEQLAICTDNSQRGPVKSVGRMVAINRRKLDW